MGARALLVFFHWMEQSMLKSVHPATASCLGSSHQTDVPTCILLSWLPTGLVVSSSHLEISAQILIPTQCKASRLSCEHPQRQSLQGCGGRLLTWTTLPLWTWTTVPCVTVIKPHTMLQIFWLSQGSIFNSEARTPEIALPRTWGHCSTGAITAGTFPSPAPAGPLEMVSQATEHRLVVLPRLKVNAVKCPKSEP